MPIELEGNFFDRCAQQQAYGRNENIHRYVIAGDYSARRLVWGYDDIRHVGPEALELAGAESWMADRIDTALQDSSDLFIAHDAGGGIGVTWLKFAALFPDAIAESRLALVVSNLSGGVERYLERQSRTQTKASRLHARYGERVHYIPDNFAATTNSAIRLPSGETVHLRGNTDLMHECASLTSWSKIPEVHIPSLGRRLSSRGMYFVSKYSGVRCKGTAGLVETAARRRGVASGRLALESMLGLTRVETVEAGSLAGRPLEYLVFRGPEAPPVALGAA